MSAASFKKPISANIFARLLQQLPDLEGGLRVAVRSGDRKRIQLAIERLRDCLREIEDATK